MKFSLLLLTLSVAISGCSDSNESVAPSEIDQINSIDSDTDGKDRWYNQAQVEHGTQVFATNCAVCHGEQAQGLTEDWRQRLPDGNFPAPPLNGSAHAWHHPLEQLSSTIEAGGVPYGGQMPPFAEVLSDEDKLAAIAYFQSFWEEEIYLGWLDLGGLN